MQKLLKLKQDTKKQSKDTVNSKDYTLSVVFFMYTSWYDSWGR
jgi:hypothetical protein